MAFCQNCGSAVDGRFCQKCGAAVAGGGDAPQPPGGTGPEVVPAISAAGLTDNMAGALCYLFGFITGILFLVLAPYNQNRSIKFHAFQSIFLNIALFVIWIVFAIVSVTLHVVPVLGAIISVTLSFALWIGCLIVWFYMMFKTYSGEKIVLPVIGPIAEKQAAT
jgi:uncharacterized membrane protein